MVQICNGLEVCAMIMIIKDEIIELIFLEA